MAFLKFLFYLSVKTHWVECGSVQKKAYVLRRCKNHRTEVLKETEADSIQIGNKTQFISTDEIGNVFFISDDQLIGYNVYTQQFSTLFKQNVRSMTTKGQEIWISSNDSIRPITVKTMQ